MVMSLVRKNKVESSPHYNEIIDKLAEGESGRCVSKWLENTYGEYISFAALNRYKSKHIKMENRVEAELNKRASEKSIDNVVKKKADEKEVAEESINIVASTIADNMVKVAGVASNFDDDYEKVKRDADNPDIKNVTSKDVANLSLQANKLYNEYFKKDEANVEVNVNNVDLSEFFDDGEDSEILSDLDDFERRYLEEKEITE